MSEPIKQYLKQIEQLLQTEQATEHSYRAALETLVKQSRPEVTTINEAKRIACGAPDLTIQVNQFTIGYIEAKDIGKPLHEVAASDQLKRYLQALENLILTDYLDFHWYVGGELRLSATLGRAEKVKGRGYRVQRERDSSPVGQLLQAFLSRSPEQITSAEDIARRMAQLTHLIRDMVVTMFTQGQASEMTQGLRQALAQTLLPELDLPERLPDFADIYAQTIAYGLFAARCYHTKAAPFRLSDAAQEIPKTNPFLRQLFANISSLQFEDEPYIGLVHDLVQVLAQADMQAILSDFGRTTGQEDPIVHFYETFLAAYDPKLRELRGVYYTPKPVVSYLVRSVDRLLRSHFDLADGLTDTTMIDYKGQARPRLVLLDPAVGTGTFLYTIISFIREQFQRQGRAGMWSAYVKNHLLQQFYGFEVLMVPYAVAHFKLAWQLAGQDLDEARRAAWAYDFATHERLKIFLTNTLEEASQSTPELFWLRIITEEAQAAAKIKRDWPILVVMGNPPYSGHSANSSWKQDDEGKTVRNFIGNLLQSYYQVDGQPLGERNPKWLQDDYVKFIRWGQWRIEQTGAGILAFITNHGYLDNPTFRGMRQSLLQTFDEIYLVDLHGNAKKREAAPDGGKDENVFDIQQGVALAIFVKRPHPLAPSPSNERGDFSSPPPMSGKAAFQPHPLAPSPSNERGDFSSPPPMSGEGPGVGVSSRSPTSGEGRGVAEVYHADLYGRRGDKYAWLEAHTLTDTPWQRLQPQAPFYLFIPQNVDLLGEYEQGWKVTDIFPVNSVGVVTARDNLTIHWTSQEAWQTVKDFSSLGVEAAREKYDLGADARDWKVHLAQQDVKESGLNPQNIKPILYRPFDIRYTYYTGKTRGFICMPRREVMQHIIKDNLGLVTIRRSRDSGEWRYILATNMMIAGATSLTSLDINYLFPLYLYPDNNQLFNTSAWSLDEHGRVPNLNPAFVEVLAERVGAAFQPHPLAPSPSNEWGNFSSPPLMSGEAFHPHPLTPSPSNERGDASSPPLMSGKAAFHPHPLAPSPSNERGDASSPPLMSGEGLGVGVGKWQTSPELWAKLKPLARQMRHEPTLAEDTLWQEIRNKKILDLKFRRQHTIDRFIVDFYCREANLIIEVDGESHDYTPHEDAIRQEFLESQGYRVIRFTNAQVLQELQYVLEQIALVVKTPPHPISGEAAFQPHPLAPSPSNERGDFSSPPLMSGEAFQPHPLAPSNEKGDFSSPHPISGEAAFQPPPLAPSPSNEKGDFSSPPLMSGEGLGVGVSSFTPEDILHYIYAIFHHPTYRQRYAEFLKIDFPRVPLPRDGEEFWQLAAIGQQLVGLHFLTRLPALTTQYPVTGNNDIAKGFPKYEAGRIYLNKAQYFTPIDLTTWEFQLGGYQVLDKWLKDRRGRSLSYSELQHYQKIIAALQETQRLMAELATISTLGVC